MSKSGAKNYNKYKTVGGQYGTGYGYSIVNLYNGEKVERISCYSCVYCYEKKCSKVGMPIPMLGKDSWENCKYFSMGE